MFLDNQNEKGGIIALVTDGKNTKYRTSINDVSTDIIDAGIRVVTIAFGFVNQIIKKFITSIIL